jgi:hypothetical protein
MALEDMQSQYGPINKKGKIGTGVDKDPSKYGLTPLGKPQEKFGGTGERSMGKTPGERMLEI